MQDGSIRYRQDHCPGPCRFWFSSFPRMVFSSRISSLTNIFFLPPSTCPTGVHRGRFPGAPIVLQHQPPVTSSTTDLGFHSELYHVAQFLFSTEPRSTNPSLVWHVRHCFGRAPCFLRMSAQAGPHPARIIAIKRFRPSGAREPRTSGSREVAWTAIL
jgi:hypothetical protein